MKSELPIKAYIELFHLLFLEQLSQKLDKRLYALKGGCNLRFFLNSIRYSEDIDLDVHTVASHTLQKIVDNILAGQSFAALLNTHAIAIANFSAPKQTPTTQRWKLQLKINHLALPINTKIEFSRRDATTDAVFTSISSRLLMQYNLRPLFIPHYPSPSAIIQKINALILRTETQARDVFDLYQLLQSTKINIAEHFTTDNLQIAIDHAVSIDFAAFKSQVVSYLEFAYQAQFDDAAIWDSMVLNVCEHMKLK